MRQLQGQPKQALKISEILKLGGIGKETIRDRRMAAQINDLSGKDFVFLILQANFLRKAIDKMVRYAKS